MREFDLELMQTDVPLAPLTTLRVGGPAAYFYAAESAQELWEALAWARGRGLRVLILGGGSNLVLPDAGYDGLVLHPNIRGMGRATLPDGRARWHVGAGLDWDALVARTVARGHAGLECLSGIPGKVGAAPIQNIGAYGQELGQVLERVFVMDTRTGDLVMRPAGTLGLGYRTSVFKHGPSAGRHVVLSIDVLLQPDGPPTVRYPDLQQRLGPAPSLAEVRDAVLAVRAEKSMLADADDDDARGCGSFFTNPVLDAAAYAAFAARVARAHPHYPAGDGRVKLSAAWLIEQAGFAKGTARGPVGLSRKHCLALVNRGGACAADVRAFAAELQAGVQQAFGIRLEPEPVIVSETAP